MKLISSYSIPTSYQPRVEFGHAELLKAPWFSEIFVVIVGQMLQGETSSHHASPLAIERETVKSSSGC